MEHCKQGFDVTRELSETQLVTTSCGSMIPGTPDGGFVDSNGLLRLVQVVRVPLLPEMSVDEVEDVLYRTVLAKIVKSQAWMKQTCTIPHEFIIFCWLPPVGAYEVCIEQSEALLWTEALISNVQSGGWPFSLVIEVPKDPGGIFPANFGLRTNEKRHLLDTLCYFFNPADFADDDEPMEWYLFDEDAEDETSEDEGEHRDAEALIALAIHVIENAGEQGRTHLILGQQGLLEHFGEESLPSQLQVSKLFQLSRLPAARDRECGVGLIIVGLPWCGLEHKGFRFQVAIGSPCRHTDVELKPPPSLMQVPSKMRRAKPQADLGTCKDKASSALHSIEIVSEDSTVKAVKAAWQSTWQNLGALLLFVA
eukprot:TRINITY_DN96049_c0_g1_i1.p1 TRINITY_DN96049_c0_g1~~TRINITY_DN96049_c0_g1_i1.p1  ORF type:complete len:416 (-),score=79.26 TRINITY_DN96049_c0_g1_i1:97-1194(-)